MIVETKLGKIDNVINVTYEFDYIQATYDAFVFREQNSEVVKYKIPATDIRSVSQDWGTLALFEKGVLEDDEAKD